MANQSHTLSDLIAQYAEHDAAYPGDSDPLAELRWNERAELLEHLIATTRPVSVECIASALEFAVEHSDRAPAHSLLCHCAALLRAA